jgi:hypothetical protein
MVKPAQDWQGSCCVTLNSADGRCGACTADSWVQQRRCSTSGLWDGSGKVFCLCFSVHSMGSSWVHLSGILCNSIGTQVTSKGKTALPRHILH